jgi:hypothetical protein
MKRWLLAVGLALAALAPATAQDSAPPPPRYEVFAERAGAATRLHFVSMITGEEVVSEVQGARFTLAGGGVVFTDPQGAVQFASAQGELGPHPFIRVPAGARRVDFAASPDGAQIAWTITSGTPDALATESWVAASDGSSMRLVLRDGPHDGIRAFPVTFSADGGLLYMDYQPDTIADLAPFQQYASLFAVDLATSATYALPGEAACYCGGDIRAGVLVRLALGDVGFDVNVIDLATGALDPIRGAGLADYTLGGDVRIAPDGSLAVYALARPAPDGRETLFVLVDRSLDSVRVLGSPVSAPLRPVAWTADGGAVLLTRADQDGTWRLDAKTGALIPVARASYLGTL